MPPKLGGKRTKRTKKGGSDQGNAQMPIADPKQDQMYGVATKMLGNRRFTVSCSDGKERLALIPGKFKGRRSWIDVNTYVLLNIRDYQDDKTDVIYIYNPGEVKKLKKYDELATFFDEEKQDMVVFDHGFNDESSEDDIIPEQQLPLEMPEYDDSVDLDDL